MTSSSTSDLHINPSSPHTHTVVFLHDRGDNAQSCKMSLGHWRDSRGRSLPEVFGTFRWVFPQAPLRRCASLGVTWPQWFDTSDGRAFSSNQDREAEGLRQVIPILQKIIAAEVSTLGGRWDRVILAGSSMGAATGAHILFNLDIPKANGGRLAAFMGFSCRCPFAGRDLAAVRKAVGLKNTPHGNEVVAGTPMLLEHCADDALVRVYDGKAMRDTLRGFGAQVEWKLYPDGGNWFNSPQGADDAIKFLSRHVLAQELQ
ncbi:phospholipase/carboxylesterase family protein [Stachybotrys elegans]|uniref:Phospholipase/carboxylesterase family protein n=1 Tax=Stachybotrys elegans TaxID=80388 RepID=A0A8K0SEN9_9HYPO|nr:phospholipase/carboxylesterase family protein [Stachybotrys elegans]